MSLLIDWYWSVMIITCIYQFLWTNRIAFCRNIGLCYEVNDTRLSSFRYQSRTIEAITPIWYMGVAMVGQILPATYWWSCVAYSGLLNVAKSVTWSLFCRLGRFDRGSKSARALSAVVSIVSVVVLMVVENVLRADQTLPSYQCRTVVILRSYWQSWTDKDRELTPRYDGFVTIMTDWGGLLWSGTSAENDRHSVTWALPGNTPDLRQIVILARWL